MKDPSIKISIVDDHTLVIGGIEKLITRYPHLELISTYSNGADLMEGLRTNQPDVLLLDIQMPGKTGEELLPLIRKQYPSIRIIALTGYDTPYYIQSMMANGCKGYLLKNTNEKDLVEAIETVYNGGNFIEKSIKEDLLINILKQEKRGMTVKSQLTHREKDILRLIMEEDTSPEIAEKLHLSLRTVEKYRLNLLQKLQVKNTAGLVKLTIKQNLLDD